MSTERNAKNVEKLNIIEYNENMKLRGVKCEVREMLKNLEKCNICPHNCNVNRLKGEIGRCKCDNTVKIALASLHYFEEPCISGKEGSGTVFFTNCNLSCKYCQNYEISQGGKGKEISIGHLAEIFINQQNKGANNINLVTPTMYVYQIIEAIKLAKSKGLNIPIIYNSNGYENVETLKLLEGYIDVYLPDLKYAEDDLGREYSGINNYFENAIKAIKEMYRQVGYPIFNDKGIIQKGLIIRHLILPNSIENSKKVLKWIDENIDKKVYVSIMAQYFPTYKAKEDERLNRKLTKEEYEEIEDYLYSLNIENGYMQELRRTRRRICTRI